MAKKLSSSKKPGKATSTSNPRGVSTLQMSPAVPMDASTAVVPQGKPRSFNLTPTYILIQTLPQAVQFVSTVVQVGNELN